MKRFNYLQDPALLLLRIVTAVTFFHAGIAKGFLWSADPTAMGMSVPMWQLMKFLSIAEPIGAIALVLGAFTRWVGLANGIIMVGALWIMGYTYGTAYFTMPQAPGLDFNAHLLVESIILLAFGGGAWSLDALLEKRRKKA